MKKYKIITSLLLGLLAFASCTEEEALISENNTIVIEGYLTAGMPLQDIKITTTKSANEPAEVDNSVEGLMVTISDGENTFTLMEEEKGVYGNPNILVQEDTEYSFALEWNNETVSAETYVPSKKEASLSTSTVQIDQIVAGSFGGFLDMNIDPIELTWDNAVGDYYFITIENLNPDAEFINENLADLEEDDPRLRQYVAEPTTGDFFAMQPMVHFSKYGTHEVVLYRVNPEYALLFDDSGNTTQSLREPSTNVVNGLGIFTGISSDTLYLQVQQ